MRTRTWCRCHRYAAGDVVIYEGAAWRATAAVPKGRAPGTVDAWVRLPTVTLAPKADMAESRDARIGRGL